MITRPFDDILADVLALCGIPDSNTDERARIARFINMRARKAYQASEYWPRFYKVGEERIVSEDGLLPYEEDGKDTIGTVLRVHRTEPFGVYDAGEYPNLVPASGGIQITGYCPSDYTGYAPIRVSIAAGFLIPDVTGDFDPTGDVVTGAYGGTAPIYQHPDNQNYLLAPTVIELSAGSPTLISWRLTGSANDYWDSGSSADYLTPDLASGDFTANGGAFGDPVLEKVPTYSAYVTYKAATSETYESGEEVPEEWEGYMARGAFADWLRSEQRPEEAAIAEAEARDYLDDQLCRISINGSDAHTRVVTHSNTQAR